MISQIITTTPDSEIVSSRIFNAPIELAFAAWTEPDHLKNWWGPAGFTNTFHEFDLKPGGKWKLTMHGPEQGHYQNESVFTKITPPLHIAWYRISNPLFRVAVYFSKVNEFETKVVFQMIFETAAECNRPYAPEKNVENFDKLEIELLKMHDAT